MAHGEYRDHTLVLEDQVLTIKGYYFPWFGPKRVPLDTISQLNHDLRADLTPRHGH